MDKVLEKLKALNIDKMVAAAVADDPEIDPARLRSSLQDMQQGNWARVHRPPQSLAAATRNHLGMSQSTFAARLGISVSTLRSWESGNRKPSGAAAVLLNLLNLHPELVSELARA